MTGVWTQGLAARLHAQAPEDGDWMAALLADRGPDGQGNLGDLPFPGSGSTLHRWQALAAVAHFDLALAKLYEGHTDALAIMAELGEPIASRGEGSWGVWASEAPGGKTFFEAISSDEVRLYGTKFWCSGAATADNALLTAWAADGSGPQLFRLALDQPGIHVDANAWKAVGMVGSASLDVAFDGARAHRVGKPGDYLSRPGFWQGGAGVAACWYGGARGIAQTLHNAVIAAPPTGRTPFRLAALGKIDLALHSTVCVLREAAAWIDAQPKADASQVALTCRLAAEQCARQVLDEAGCALGAGAFCRDAKFARAAADLPVFIRQSHAEHDFAALGERTAEALQPWAL